MPEANTFKRIIHFNTGRLYQSYGQVVFVGVLADGTIIFDDRSRGVSGQLTKIIDEGVTDATLQRLVMREYDHSDWRDPRYEHADYKHLDELRGLTNETLKEYLEKA